MSDVRCQMSDVRCQISDIRCQMSDVRGQVLRTSVFLSSVICHLSSDLLDHEKQQNGASDRNRQGGDSDRDRPEIRNRGVPRGGNQLHPPDHHAQRGLRPHSVSSAWMRLMMSANRGPYFSHTGFTASWNGFLSATSNTWMPAAVALPIASFS